MYCDLWPYVWLIIESGFKSRAAYGGARTVFMAKESSLHFVAQSLLRVNPLEKTSKISLKSQNATSKKKMSNFSKFLVYILNTDFELDYVNERVERI